MGCESKKNLRIYKTIVTSFPKVMTIERKIFDELLAKGIAECGKNKIKND